MLINYYCFVCNYEVKIVDIEFFFGVWFKLFLVNCLLIIIVEKLLFERVKFCDLCKWGDDEKEVVFWCWECGEVLCD